MANFKGDFIKIFNDLSHSKNSNQVWNDLIECMAVSISNAIDVAKYKEREKTYMECAARLGFSPLMGEALACIVNALEENPAQDFLGVVYGDLGLLTSRKGQFFTPMSVSQLMAGMQLSDAKDNIDEQGYIVVDDPSCGAGSTLIAAANELRNMGINYQTSVLFTGNDIDPVVAKMCYIQLSMLGCPGYVAIANTLTNPVVGHNLVPVEKETQDFWYTPMFCSDIWVMRRKCHVMDNFLRS